MAVNAITPNYTGEIKDGTAQFAPNLLLFVNWLDHLMFACPLALVVSPDMTLSALATDILPGCYNQHPDWAKVDMSKAVWELDGKPFKADLNKSLKDQGVGHKSMLRFETPGLKGIGGVGF